MDSCQLLVLDLTNVEYISSAGLRVMIAQLKKYTRVSKLIVLAAPQVKVMQTIELAGLEIVLDIYNDVETAKNAYTKPEHLKIEKRW